MGKKTTIVRAYVKADVEDFLIEGNEKQLVARAAVERAKKGTK